MTENPSPSHSPSPPPKKKKGKTPTAANPSFDPRIVVFACNWCSYAGADSAGGARLAQDPSFRIIRVMCSGMIHPNLVVNALTNGADGVLACG